MRKHDIIPRILLILYLLFLLWLVLFKFSLHIAEVFDLHVRGLNLLPFAGVMENDSRDLTYNIVFFVPYGLLLGINLKRATFWQRLLYVFYFSLTVEIVQFIFAIGITDVTDVIANTTGGLAGLTLYKLARQYVDKRILDRWATGAVGVLLALGFTLILTLQLFHNAHRLSFADKPAAPPSPLTGQNVRYAWPATGRAAIGSVEDGLLASSSASEKPHPMASMAKVITALAIMEKQPLEPGRPGPSYTLTAEDVANYRAEVARGGSVVPIYEGMVLTQHQALQMMLIASANNMADTLAERIFGSEEAYVSFAQNMLRRMGLHHTNVADASGFSPATVSTPSELVTIGIAALKNPVIAEIVAEPQAQISGVGTITNTNELLGTNGVIGIKTGTTDQAGYCLLSAARYITPTGQEITLIGVVMGDSDAAHLFSDSKRLLTSVKKALGLEEINTDDSTVASPPAQNVQALRRKNL